MKEVLDILQNCPKTLEYLTLDKDEDCPLCWDIKGLMKNLPKLTTTLIDGPMGEAEEWRRFILSVSWVIIHLQEIRDELKKGGEV